MNAPEEPSSAQLSQTPVQTMGTVAQPGKIRAAAVVDQWELFRLGVESVLGSLNIHVTGSSVRAGEGLRIVRDETVDLFIVGKHVDLKPQHALREAKKHQPALKVMVFVDNPESTDVARLLSWGADALLLRTATRIDVEDAILRLRQGERVVASALAVGTVGRVGPKLDVSEVEAGQRSGLSARELEVLAELATGATYKQIAESLVVTQATVKTHLVHIYAKLGVKTRYDAIARALALGLLG